MHTHLLNLLMLTVWIFLSGIKRARANPSVGSALAFQSFACNVRNSCYDPEDFEEIPTYEKSRYLEFLHHAGPIFNDDQLLLAVTEVPTILRLFNATVTVFNKTSIVKFVENEAGFGDFFNSPEKLKSYLTNVTRTLNPVQADLLIDQARFNASTMIIVSNNYACYQNE